MGQRLAPVAAPLQCVKIQRECSSGLLSEGYVWITTDQLGGLHNKFNEMLCKLDSTENLRSFEKYPTLSLWLLEIRILGLDDKFSNSI